MSREGSVAGVHACMMRVLGRNTLQIHLHLLPKRARSTMPASVPGCQRGRGLTSTASDRHAERRKAVDGDRRNRCMNFPRKKQKSSAEAIEDGQSAG